VTELASIFSVEDELWELSSTSITSPAFDLAWAASQAFSLAWTANSAPSPKDAGKTAYRSALHHVRLENIWTRTTRMHSLASKTA
jgi:hypothetical protein